MLNRLLGKLLGGLDFTGDLMTPAGPGEPWYYGADGACWHVCWQSSTGETQRLGPMPYQQAYSVQGIIAVGVPKWLERDA